jgi:hypothetical protein
LNLQLEHFFKLCIIPGNFSSLSRPETPNRTLINPVLRAGGGVTTTQTIHSGNTSGGPLTPQSPECASEVRLDNNGHVRIVALPDGQYTAEQGSS